MLYSAVATVALLASSASAAAIRRQTAQPAPWYITNFSVASYEEANAAMQLDLEGEGKSVFCGFTSTAIGACPNARGPTTFSPQACSSTVPDTGFSWSVGTTNSPLENGGTDYFIKFLYAAEGEETLYACSPAFSASNYTCESGGETLNVPSSFSVQPSYNSECIYA